jgi:Pyruvate/2-oxoacid:ferredoxin oxidoreductase delta subunit
METITVKPYIIARRCPAQEDVCKVIAACPQGAITYVKDEGEPLGGKIVFDYDKCDGCGLCVTECCGAAVEMK